VRSVPRSMPSAMTTPSEPPMPDKLYSSIELEYRGHDPEVLKSYTKFVEISSYFVCTHLNLTRGRFQVVPYVRWIQPALRSKFVHKKYKLHYETRTHITLFEVRNLTGSTASTFLEYIQRNIPEEKELDEITDELLSMMLGEQEFLDRWAMNVEAELAHAEEVSVSSAVLLKELLANVKRQDPLVPIFEELTHALDASSQTFLSSVDLMICHCEPEHNRDASLLFAVRLQIDRISTKKVDRDRCTASARRLLHLVRLFTTRISSSFQVLNTSAFATSLCDMLYTFCDNVLNSTTMSENMVSDLRRAVDDFNEIVVEKLSKSAFEAHCAWDNVMKSKHRPFFSPQPTRLRQPLIQIQQRSPGYLLPRDLLKKRQKRLHSCNASSLMRTVLAPTFVPSKKMSSRSVTNLGPGKLVCKRDRVTNSDRNSTKVVENQDDTAIRLARKISCEVVKDLRKRYGNVNLGILGI
ncbi:hypothetical protein Angca_009928, partial [Angiostrongylus cantonensis]